MFSFSVCPCVSHIIRNYIDFLFDRKHHKTHKSSTVYIQIIKFFKIRLKTIQVVLNFVFSFHYSTTSLTSI